jgi:hypothetical protein
LDLVLIRNRQGTSLPPGEPGGSSGSPEASPIAREDSEPATPATLRLTASSRRAVAAPTTIDEALAGVVVRRRSTRLAALGAGAATVAPAEVSATTTSSLRARRSPLKRTADAHDAAFADL